MADPLTLSPSEMRVRWERADFALAALLVALTAIRTFFAASIGLSDDEAYYRLWSLAPALGYYDHAPMVAWFIAAGRAVFGDTALGVRLMAIAGSLLGALVVWRTASLLFGATVGRLATLFAVSMPLLGAGAIVITPDTPSTLFATLGLWALAELRTSRNAYWWLAVGLFAGLGLLSKYTNLFFGASILLWLIALKENRRWFLSWQLWAGGLLALLLFTPVVLWNAEHGWVSLAKQLGRVGHSKGFGLVYEAELFGAMLALLSPVIAVLAVVGLARSLAAIRQHGDSAHMLLVATIAPLLLYFVIHALHDRVQANWPAPVYPPLAIAAAIGATAGLRAQARSAWSAHEWLPGIASGVGLAMTGLLYLHALSPLYLAEGRPEATHQLHGWEQLARDVERIRQERNAQWIATASYATTAQLAFRLDRHVPVLQLNERIRYINLPMPDRELLERPALYVELERRAKRADLTRRFESVEPVGTLERTILGVTLARYSVFVVSRPRGMPLDPIAAGTSDQGSRSGT